MQPMTSIHAASNPSAIVLSGYYYPNKMIRILLDALQDVMGLNGLNAVLNRAGLPQFRDQRPPENLDRQFDFAYLAALKIAVEDIYGERGGRSLAQRAGRALFANGLKNFGALAGAGDLAFRALPLPVKLKMGIPAVASIFNNFSDQISTSEEYGDHYLYVIKRCSECWDRTSVKPCCHICIGILQEALRWVSNGHEFRIVQTHCHACGDPDCTFAIYKDPIL